MFYIRSALDLFGPAMPSEGQIVVYYVQYEEPYHKAVCIMQTRHLQTKDQWLDGEPQSMTATEVHEVVAWAEQDILRNLPDKAQNCVNCLS